MKKGVVIGIALLLVIGASPVRQYWQDVLLQPSQEWKESFGRDMPEAQTLVTATEDVLARLTENDSILAKNINTLLLEAQAKSQRLIEMQAEIDELKTLAGIEDPNQ
jgi:hypothetical protein